jgi:hypothetical protein
MLRGAAMRYGVGWLSYGEIERTWLIDALNTGISQPGLNDYLSGHPGTPRRRVLFIRLNQSLSELLATIPRWRLRELAARANEPLPDPLPPITDLLHSYGIELGSALEIHSAMGGDTRIAELNRISTNFAALSDGRFEVFMPMPVGKCMRCMRCIGTR